MHDTLAQDINAAERLLADIDDNPLHPANDARHPGHGASVQAYHQIEQWCLSLRLQQAKKAVKWAAVGTCLDEAV